MSVFKEFIVKVSSFEGFSRTPYFCPSGVLTIGYGHTHGVVPGMIIDEEIAFNFLMYDITLCEQQLLSLHPKISVYSGLYFALTDFIFNVGFTNYKNSTLRKIVDSIKDYSNLTENDITSLSVQLNLWCYSKGKKLRGLEKRRNFEISLLKVC